jgi:hypothetical protein
MAGNNRPLGSQRVKISGTINGAKPCPFELIIAALRIAQIENFTDDSGILLPQRPITHPRHLQGGGR